MGRCNIQTSHTVTTLIEPMIKDSWRVSNDWSLNCLEDSIVHPHRVSTRTCSRPSLG